MKQRIFQPRQLRFRGHGKFLNHLTEAIKGLPVKVRPYYRRRLRTAFLQLPGTPGASRLV